MGLAASFGNVNISDPKTIMSISDSGKLELKYKLLKKNIQRA